MEIETFDIKTKVTSRKVKLDDDFDKITVKFYWDAHGREIPWKNDEGQEQEVFKNSHAKIVSETIQYEFKFSDSPEFETWTLTVGDKKILGDITNYRISPNGRNLTLHSCVGAG